MPPHVGSATAAVDAATAAAAAAGSAAAPDAEAEAFVQEEAADTVRAYAHTHSRLCVGPG